MHYEDENAGGSFLLGLLAGAVLGAGVGLLFAPRPGSETRRRVQEQARNFGDTASQAYGQASEKFTDLAGRGRETYDRARQSVQRGVDEARRYAGDAADTAGRYAQDAAKTARSYANDAADTASRAGQQSVNDINSRLDRM